MKIHISFLFRVVVTSLIVFTTTITLFTTFGNRLKNHYLSIACLQAEKVNSLVSLNSVSSLLKERYSQVQFLLDEEDVIFNTGELNTLLKDSVNLIYQEIKKVEDGNSDIFQSKYGKGIIYEIPFSLFSDNVLYSSLGPKIPVKFFIVGDIKGSISYDIEEFGINNALININLLIEMSSRVTVPLTSDIVLSKTSIPIYSKLFTGEIPSLYYPSIQGVNDYYSTEIKL